MVISQSIPHNLVLQKRLLSKVLCYIIVTLVMDTLVCVYVCVCVCVCVCVMCMSMHVELFAPALKTINTSTTLNL